MVLFGRNITSEEQLRALVGELRALWPRGGPTPLIAVDQEGGQVQRLKPPSCPSVEALPPMRHAARELSPEALRGLGARVGRELASFGFNLDFAPVLDVDTNPENPIIGERAFGTTPQAVIEAALPFALGLGDAGVLACGKHFPGHGDTATDSHLALPRLAHSRSRLESIELPPFRAAVEARLPLLMTAHILIDALDSRRPATLSPRIIPRLLRQALGYDGVVISDDLEMRAVADHYDVDAIAEGCVAADVDLLLVCRSLDFANELADALERAESPADARRARARIGALRARALDHAEALSRSPLA